MPAASVPMSCPIKEAKKENKEYGKDEEEEEENPTSTGSGVTVFYDD